MLSLTHVDVTVDDLPLVTDLTLDAPPGAVVAVTGANGSGKSTLLRCVAGLRTADRGSITLDGVPADDTDPRFRSRVALHLGDDAVLPELTVAEHLELLCTTRRLASHLGGELIRGAGIDHLSDRFPHTLSTGQRARFDLCAAFLPGASLIVLDEPETGLDAAGRTWLTATIRRAQQAGSIVVAATHRTDIVDGLDPTTLEVGR